LLALDLALHHLLHAHNIFRLDQRRDRPAHHLVAAVAQKALAGFAETARSNGIRIVVFHLPELRELKPYPFQDVTDKVHKVVDATGMPFIDLLPDVENMDPSTLWVTVPDPHPNAKADTAFTDGMIKTLTPMLDDLCRDKQKGCGQ